jgi:DNA polymerase-3 subunit delta'
MTWQGIKGHDAVVHRFQRALERGRLAGSFLFVGLSGIGKRMFALALAKGLLCKGNDDSRLDPCGECESCRLFETAQHSAPENEEKSKKGKTEEPKNDEFISPHPDLYYVSKPPEKSFLPLELLIGDKEHRGQSGLCYNISRTPFLGHRKVGILDAADFLNAEGANAMLKTLEEPPSDSVLILIGTSTTKQLPTIRSRCQIIRFSPLSPQILGSLLVEQGVVATLEQALKLSRRVGGSLDQAKDFFDDDVETIRSELSTSLSSRRLDSVSLASKLNEFVEAIGKEAPLRRRRLRLVFNLAMDHFREKMKKSELLHPSDEAAANQERHENEALHAAHRLDRTLDALEQIDRNANIPFIVDAWCADLSKC